MCSRKEHIFLEGRKIPANDEDIEVSLQTCITIFTLAFCDNYDCELHFINSTEKLLFSVKRNVLEKFKCFHFSRDSKEFHCSLPFIECEEEQLFIGGLSGVLRRSILTLVQKNYDHPYYFLLGFRGGCLSTCSESSTFTKFCDVDLPDSVNQIASSVQKKELISTVPVSLVTLESHMQHPVRTHNAIKKKYDLSRKHKKSQTINQNSTRNQNTNQETKRSSKDAFCDILLEHTYLEGIYFTLADLIALPCVHFLLENLPICAFHKLPFIAKWYETVLKNDIVQKVTSLFQWNIDNITCKCASSNIDVNFPVLDDVDVSLYSKRSVRPKVNCQTFDPTSVIESLKEHGIKPHVQELNSPELNWPEFPAHLHPISGDVPKNRVKRKCEQLESIVSAVVKLASPGQTIVDFCSGGGHAGLILSYLLPKCYIYLIENKEESIHRARKRATALHLKNIKFFRCNMNYFNGRFDVGLSLHACGVATDMVIEKCLQNQAAFVCCPCCYGVIHNTHVIEFPLSKKFSCFGISCKEFYLLAHCADQTESNTEKLQQGLFCMKLVDTDRALYAEEYGYDVKLTTLQPITCSPKHNLLIGVPSS